MNIPRIARLLPLAALQLIAAFVAVCVIGAFLVGVPIALTLLIVRFTPVDPGVALVAALLLEVVILRAFALAADEP